MLPVQDVVAPEDDASVRRPVPWGGLVARLRASQLLRRALPLRLALLVLDLAERRAGRRNPSRLTVAREAMDAVLGGTTREAEAADLAFGHRVARGRAWEFAWRPWLLDAIPIDGLDRLAGIEPGRGVILSRLHSGPPGGLGNLLRALEPVHLAVGDYLLAPAPPGYNGYQNEQTRTLLTRSGCRLVRAAGSRDVFAAVLRAGGRVLVHFDVPGTAPVRFLGTTVEVKSGTARLAMETDAVVVPVALLPDGRGWRIHVAEPLDPRDHADWPSLLQAVADAHEPLLLQAPEQLESPLRDGGWAVANRTGWHTDVPLDGGTRTA
jgi:lauroyl/myristoyl acyltransferase